MLVAGLLLLVITITMSVACTSSASSAKFEIASLVVKPTAVTVGEKASISAQITNIGTAGGDYIATLSVDGEKIEACSKAS